MDWVTVQYSSNGNRVITECGPVVHRKRSTVVIHPVRTSTRALRIDLHKQTGFVLSSSRGKSQSSEIDVIASRIWESDYELHVQLPDIDRVDDNRGRMNIYGSSSKVMRPIGSKSFKLRVDDVKVGLSYKNDVWVFTIPSVAKNLRGQIIQENSTDPRYLKSTSSYLYLHSDTPFEPLSLLV